LQHDQLKEDVFTMNTRVMCIKAWCQIPVMKLAQLWVLLHQAGYISLENCGTQMVADATSMQARKAVHRNGAH
jgi:hypothetical protein